MGCWNGTCMISNLPIIFGEKIKLVFLSSYPHSDVKGKSDYCESTDILSPCLYPISGSYDYYGSMENIDLDWNYDICFKSFKEFFGEKIIVGKLHRFIIGEKLR